jgi:hypothetical protein
MVKSVNMILTKDRGKATLDIWIYVSFPAVVDEGSRFSLDNVRR